MTEETAIAAVALAHVSKNQFLLQFSGGEPLLQFPLIRKVVDFVEKNHGTDADTNEWSFAGERHWKVAF